MNDSHNLQRFVDAQDRYEIYLDAVHELRSGLKERHWMWFVFPQIAGLGRTPIAQLFEIADLEEARAYLAHPVLGPRLVDCARILTELPGSDPEEIFGATDAMKLRSSMTLFARAATQGQVFRDVLEQYYAGEEDEATTSRLQRGSPAHPAAP